MRLTALCVCGTLLAFSSLSRIRAEEGVLLGDRGFGPCVATLRPVGECKPEDHDSTCPYHIILPPLVVDMPQHLLELENILLDLQKLKDSVDELREMCADCTGGQAGRKCGRKNEGELDGGKRTNEDKGDWMNERLVENDRDFRQECGEDGVKVETMDGDNDMEKKLKERNEWEKGGVVKENEGEEHVTEGASGEDTLTELQMPTSGANMQTVNVAGEKMIETNLKGTTKKLQNDMLEGNEEKPNEESGHPIWRDKTQKQEKNTKAEAFDGIKMSMNHTLNINKEQGQAEMEKGIKVNSNKKKPKQMERFEFTEKGKEIKTVSEQRDGDGETSSSMTTEKTDFLSISPTSLTTGLTSRPQWRDTKSFTSSLPSPSPLISTLSSITDVIPDPKAGYGLTGSTEPGAAGVTALQRQAEAQLSTTTETISTVGGPGEKITNAGAGLIITTPATTTPLQSLFITSSLRVINRSHGSPKKNVSSKPKIDLKRPLVQKPKPGEKDKPGIKAGAEKRLKNAKNDHKPNQGASTEGKTKANQKQKPHKPTGVKFKPGKDSRQIQNKKPGQRTTPDISATEKNPKNKLMHKQEAAVDKPKSKHNSSTSVQRPQAVNTTQSGKYTISNKKSDEVPDTDQNFKLEKTLAQHCFTNKSDQKLDESLDSEGKLNEPLELRQNPNHPPNPTAAPNHSTSKDTRNIPTFKPEHISEYESTSKPNQKRLNGSVGKFEENIDHETTNRTDLSPGQNIIPDRLHASLDNMKDPSQKHFGSSQEFETETATPLTESEDNSEENSLQEPKYNPDLTPGQTSAPDKATVTPHQKENSSQDHLKTENKPESTQEPSSESNKREHLTNKPKQTLLIEPMNQSNENPSHDAKLNPDLTPGQTSAPDQPAVVHPLTNKSSQGIHTTKHKPKPINPKLQGRETTVSPKPNSKLLTQFGEKSEENPLRKAKNPPSFTTGQRFTSDRANPTLNYINNSSQEVYKSKHKLETNKEYKSETTNKPDENSLQEFISNPHLTPGQTSAVDEATKGPGQKDHLEDTLKPEDIHALKYSKSETSNTKPSPMLVGIHEEKSRQELTPNPGLKPGLRFKPALATTSPNQIEKPNEDHLEDKHKPENIQELMSNKSETATPKPNQKLLTELVEQAENFQEPTSYPGLTPGQTFTPHRTTTTPDQIDQSNRKHPNSQTSQEFKIYKSETATLKTLVESRDKFQEIVKSLQKPTSIPGLQAFTMDLATATTHRGIISGQEHLKTKHNPEKIYDLTSNKSKTAPKPNQKVLPKSVDKSEDKKQTTSFLDLAHRQTSTPDHITTTPDQINTFHDKYINTQTSEEFKSIETETASQSPSTESWNNIDQTYLQGPTPIPGLTSGHRFSLDLVTTTPNQMKKSTNTHFQTEPATARPKPLTRSWEKSKIASLQEPMYNPGLPSGETSTSDPSTATTDQINTSIHNYHGAKQTSDNMKEFKSNKSEPARIKPNQKPSPEAKSKEPAPDKAKKLPDQRSKPSPNVPKLNKTPKPAQEPTKIQKDPKLPPILKTKPNANIKTNKTQQTNQRPKIPRPGLRPNVKPIYVHEKSPKAAYNKTSILKKPPFQYKPSTRPTAKPGVKHIQRPKQAVEPQPSLQTKTDPPQIRWVPSGNIQNPRTDMPPTSGLVKQIAEVSHTPGETEFSIRERQTITVSPKTSVSLENGHFPAIHAHPEDVTSSPDSRTASDQRPQTAGLPLSVNTNRGISQNVITSNGPASTKLRMAPKSEAKTLHEEESPPERSVPSPKLETTSTPSPNFRPKTFSTPGPEPPAEEQSTPSPRELRVKINQVAAFVNKSLTPKRRPEELSKEPPKGSQGGGGPEKTDGKLPTSTASTVIRDCSDHLLRGRTRSGVYLVTPDLRSSSFRVFCDMELDGGGWTVLQRRQDGSVSFNRTWAEYQAGFGELDGGEFWLGNGKMHLLTRDRDMALRVELEDFDGVAEHAQYEHFRVAGERLRYRLTVGGYSGTAGDALRFSKTYDHHNRAFSTPDRDNDRYPSGNCGAYYSSGWWFDACMAANLNGRYYVGKYKGVRDGIFWGTWHNISSEYYPTNERQSFKSVRMMIRPKSFGAR